MNIDRSKYYQTASFRKNKLIKAFGTELIKFLRGVLYFTIILVVLGVILLQLGYNISPFKILSWLRDDRSINIIIILLGIYTLCIFLNYITFKEANIFRILKISSYKKHYDKLTKIISSQQVFALYLRDFKSGRELKSRYIYAPGGGNLYDFKGSFRMKRITKLINKYVPVVFLDNPLEITTSYYGIPVYVEDENWHQAFITLSEHCSFVVIDYDSNYDNSTHIRLELDYIVNNNLKIVSFADELFYNKLAIEYPSIQKQILYTGKVKTEYRTTPTGRRAGDLYDTVAIDNELKSVLRELKNVKSKNERTIE